MPIYHREIAQYSPAYDRLKLGLPTSSNFSKLITAVEGKRSSQWRTYAHHLIAERMLGRKDDSYTSPFMERGLILESEAVEWYEWVMGESPGGLDGPIQTIGFITTDDGTIGCTPDRLVGDAGLVEVKCPMPTAQVGYLLEGVDREHWPQLQGQLLVTEPDREWNDIIAYHGELDRAVVRVYRDEPYIKKLKHELDHLLHYIADSMAKIEAKRRGLPPPPDFAQRLSRRLTADPRQGSLDRLKEDLQASLAREDKTRSTGTAEAQTEVVGDRPMPGVLPHRELGETSAPLTEPVPEPDAGGVARSARGEAAGEASANLASPLSESADATPQPGVGGGGSSGRKGEPPTKVWRCECGEEFEIYGAFSRHRQRTGHKAEQAPLFSNAPSDMLSRLNPADTEETFWDIAARSGDYRAEIPDKNIATLGRDTMMNLIKTAPTLEAMIAFYNANEERLGVMGRARVLSRTEVMKAFGARKKQLHPELS